MVFEVRDRHAHFDLDPASAVPELTWLQLIYVLGQDYGKFLAAAAHQEWSDCIVLIAW